MESPAQSAGVLKVMMTSKAPGRTWSLVNGWWWVVDRTRPSKTFTDLFMEQPARLAFARKYNPHAQFIVTMGDFNPNDY